MGLETALWRAVAVFRVASLGYAIAVMAWTFDRYSPVGGGLILGLMGAWTALASYLYAAPARRGWPLQVADLLITAGCLYASRWVIDVDDLHGGALTLPAAWVASPVLAWAICGGRRRGAIAGLAMGLVGILTRGGMSGVTANEAVLLFLVGVAMGHASRITVDVERRLQQATELEAVTRERDRFARGLHDSVLQVLALVQRRGAELGGEAAELGRLAGEQEATLRALVSHGPRPDTGWTQERGSERRGNSTVDLRRLLGRFASASVHLATPAIAVLLPARVGYEVVAAVASALDNVKVHCGSQARAWVLVDDEGDAVTVSVRDDGPGIPPGRLAEAEAAGRLGIAQSIRGRIRDLGGTVDITGTPGQGTEVDLRIPRAPAGVG